MYFRRSTAFEKQSNERGGKARLRALNGHHGQASTLSLDAFRAISDWYHFAILQLLKLPRAETGAPWIAKSLGLKAIQVKEALARMERLGILPSRRRSKLTPSSESVFTPDGVPSDALKKFHEQILQKAILAVHSQSVNERNLLAVTLPISSLDVNRAGQKIRAFLESLSEELSSSPNCDSVYCFSTQLFNLTPALKGGGPS